MFLPVVIVCFQDFFSKLFGSWNHIKKIGKVCQIQTSVKMEKAYPVAKMVVQASLKNSSIQPSLPGSRMKSTVNAFHPGTNSKRHSQWDDTTGWRKMWTLFLSSTGRWFKVCLTDVHFKISAHCITIAKKSQSKWQICPLRRCSKNANYCYCMQEFTVLVKTPPKEKRY